MEKEEATPCQAHSPPQIPQRPASQLLGSVHLDLRCGAFWKMKREPVAIFIPQNLRTSPSSGQATPNSLLRLPQLLACHSGAAFEGSGDGMCFPQSFQVQLRCWPSTCIIQSFISFTEVMSLILNRRFFVRYLGFLMAGGSLQFISYAAEQKQLITIAWFVPASMSVSIQERLGFTESALPDDSTRKDSRSPAAIYIVAGTVVLATLCETLLKIYKDWRYGGIVIKRNGKGELELSNVPNVDSGTIIIDQGNNVKIIFREKERPSAKELMDSISILMKP